MLPKDAANSMPLVQTKGWGAIHAAPLARIPLFYSGPLFMATIHGTYNGQYAHFGATTRTVFFVVVFLPCSYLFSKGL